MSVTQIVKFPADLFAGYYLCVLLSGSLRWRLLCFMGSLVICFFGAMALGGGGLLSGI